MNMHRQLWQVGRRCLPCQGGGDATLCAAFAGEADSHPGLPTLRPMHFTLPHLPHGNLAFHFISRSTIQCVLL